MHDVQAKAVFAAKFEHQSNRSQFRLVRSRLQVSRVVAPIGVGQRLGSAINRAGKFRMPQQRQARAGHVGQREAQLLLRNHGETVDSRIDEEAFEPRHARSGESFDVILVIVNYAAPRRPIDAALAVRGGPFRLQRSPCGGRGKTVQGHVDKHRVTARSRGSRGSFEAFPLCATRIVDMHVGIDESGKNGRSAEVMNFVTSWCVIWSNHRLDTLAFYKDGAGTNSLGSDYAPSDE